MQGERASLASYTAGVIFSQAHMSRELVIITGKSGVGKSTWCRTAAIQARMAGLPVVGLISPAIFVKGEKVGIALIDLKSGQRRVLATRRHERSDQTGCAWNYNQETIVWANQALQAVSKRDVVFIDELGPLELVRGGGFQEGLRILQESRYSSAYVVIRPSLLYLARLRWPKARLVDLEGKLT